MNTGNLKYPENNNMILVNLHPWITWIIAVIVNGLNLSIKNHRVTKRTKKKNQNNQLICCLQETHFNFKDTQNLQVKRWKNISLTNGNQKVANVPRFISYKIDFNLKTLARDKGGQSSYDDKWVNS